MDFNLWKMREEDNKEIMCANLRISIDPELPVLRFDLDLDEIPTTPDRINKKGIEVVANFHVSDFDNDQTFYTDSNGLQM